MDYRLAKITSKRTRGIWTFDRPSREGPIKIYARCASCTKVNDLSAGLFSAKIRDGKVAYGVSGCQACMYCGLSFNGSRFLRLPLIASLAYNGQNYFSEHLKELLKIFSETKGEFFVYGVGDSRSPYLGVTEAPLSGRMVNIFWRENLKEFQAGWPAYSSPKNFATMEAAIKQVLVWVTGSPRYAPVAV